jgi:hypothetical protein
MINNIRISELPVLTSPSLSGVTTITFGNTTYQTTLQNLLNVLYNADLVTTVTYSELFNLISGSTLVPGIVYRISNYKSVNFLNGYKNAESFYNGSLTPTISGFTPLEIYTGDTEVILVTAVSDNKLSPIGLSETHQNDIISYNPIENKIGVEVEIQNDGVNITNFDLRWNGTNVYFNLPSGKTISYGKSFSISATFSGNSYNIDGKIDILTPGSDQNFDHENGSLPLGRIRVTNDGTRIFLPDLTLSDYNNYDSDSLIAIYTTPVGDAYGRIYRRNDVYTNVDVPFDFRGIKYRRFEVNLSSYLPSIGVDYYGNGENLLSNIGLTGYTGNYSDFPVFQTNLSTNIQWDGDLYTGTDSAENNVFFGYCNDLKIENYFINNTMGSFYFNKIGPYFRDNICGNGFSNNDIGIFFSNNKIDDNFSFNTILSYFTFNTIRGNFLKNKIGENFYGNNISNSFSKNYIGDDFTNNRISSGFTKNSIGYGFDNNSIGIDLTENFIDNEFNNNEVGHNFQKNKIGQLFRNNIITGNFLGNVIGTYFYLNTIDLFFVDNNVENIFQNNIIGSGFTSNKITTNFNRNEISDRFVSNVINDNFTDNLVDSNFQYNSILTNFTGNTIYIDFKNNSIGNSFRNNDISFSFNDNKILNDFYGNIVSNDFTYNEIGYDFNTNIIGSGFTQNIVLAKDLCNVDFTSASHVYNSYTCTLFKRQGNDKRLSYYDSLDTLIITDVNS